MKQLPLVLAVLAAALLGGLVGGLLRSPEQRVEAALAPTPPVVDALPGVQRELEGLREELRSLGAEVRRQRAQGAHSDTEPPSSRVPVTSDAQEFKFPGDLNAELLRLREAVRSLEKSVKEGVAREPPVPVAALRQARQQDRTAVQYYIDAWGVDSDAARHELIGATYAEVFQRFGLHYYLSKDGTWWWKGTPDANGGSDRMEIRFSGGAVMSVIPR